jgi:hypothetical protein
MSRISFKATSIAAAAVGAAAVLTAATLPAAACPAGYKRVVIQGNSICQLDASASNKLKAGTPAAKNAAIMHQKK